jgi:hypothetical protein
MLLDPFFTATEYDNISDIFINLNQFIVSVKINIVKRKYTLHHQYLLDPLKIVNNIKIKKSF